MLGATVRERVWDPIAHAAGVVREVYLVPEGPVNELPWLALPGLGRRYLAEDAVAIAVFSST